MDRVELLNDAEAAMIYSLDGRQAKTWTAIPAIIENIDFVRMTVEVQPAIQCVYTDKNSVEHNISLPVLVDVPIVFPSAGGFSLTFPLKKGDEVLVVIASRCIDSWWQSGGVQPPAEMRMHDLSDGFAIPGPKSQPRVISDISTDSVQLRNDDGTSVVGIAGTGKIQFKDAATSLKSVLTDLESAVNTFMTTLAGFSGGAAPVTQAMLQVPAQAAIISLTAVLAKIGALLE